ncbi:hypothetical protein TIFTF001_027114 [Ficus carica]|uniref:Uncharacterized protein n=1 Tax=Ficus carica TaxID=3494 RepID=A0AA88IZ57_FICCA|nr:hypothetical protein TIFTF001_027114 [Ficus carica]
MEAPKQTGSSAFAAQSVLLARNVSGINVEEIDIENPRPGERAFA